MSGNDWLAERFEANRGHLKAVAYRMLGSPVEAEDAVQECWLRVSRANTGAVENFEGWLTTVLARICLNMLRSRKTRREEGLEDERSSPQLAEIRRTDPQEEAILAESVGLALLVVLERLTPAERVAFVLHEVFSASFEEIAAILNRTPAAARKLASRARQRVRGTSAGSELNVSAQRATVEAFLDAVRKGDMQAILAVLDRGIVRRADAVAVPEGRPRELHGAMAVAAEATAFSGVAQIARPALVNGEMGFIVAPRGRLRIAVRCTVIEGKITEMAVIADAKRLKELEIADPLP